MKRMAFLLSLAATWTVAMAGPAAAGPRTRLSTSPTAPPSVALAGPGVPPWLVIALTVMLVSVLLYLGGRRRRTVVLR